MLLSQIDFDLNINYINLESKNDIEEDESDKDSNQNLGLNINNNNFDLNDENIIKKQNNIIKIKYYMICYLIVCLKLYLILLKI